MLDSGKCISCFEKNYGCGECSSTGSCDSCLNIFKTDVEGKCDSSVRVDPPKFKIVEFGRFYRKGNKVYFRIYLRVISGMMYNCKTSFKLIVTTSKKTLATEEIEGICTQTGTATGNLAKNPSVINSTAMLDCEAELSNENDTYTKLQVGNLFMKSVNGKDGYNEVVDINSLSEINLLDKEGTDFEDQMKNGGKFYAFNQISQTCKSRNGLASLKFIGSIAGYEDEVINGQIYNLTTSENQTTECTLNKEQNSDEATLSCKVPIFTETEFDLPSQESRNTDNDYNSTFALEMSNETFLCSVEDDNVSIKNGLSSGLSGGAVAGTIIGSVIVILIIGAFIGYFAFSFKAAGATAVQHIASSSQTGFTFPSTSIGNNAA